MSPIPYITIKFSLPVVVLLTNIDSPRPEFVQLTAKKYLKQLPENKVDRLER